MSTLIFAGHDTFHCRRFWLKKAHDFVDNENNFKDADASIFLGVGRNMVTAIRFWARCFQVIDVDDNLTKIGNKIFSDKGWDPYLEDFGTLWLLHYKLVASAKASTFSIVFNDLLKYNQEISLPLFLDHVNKLEKDYNQNSLKKDFNVFVKTYLAEFDENNLEESFSGILTELNLIKPIKKSFIDASGTIKIKEIYQIERGPKPQIPSEILLYAILDQNKNDISISFEKLYNEPNQIASVFNLDKEGLVTALEKIAHQLRHLGITFSNEAGVKELQFRGNINSLEILNQYYGS